MTVNARCKTDDGVFDITIDIEKWLEQASDKEITDVIKCGFGQDYPTDEIAYFFADKNDDLGEMFKYMEIISKRTKTNIGFEVIINKHEMLVWMEEHKPQLLEKVKEEERKEEYGE